jgi:hypothetical protein
VKSLLWLLLAACVMANVLLSLVGPGGATQIVLSVLSGLGVLVCGGGLWLLRDRQAG